MLHDIDRTGVDRAQPQPNTKDSLPVETRMAHGTHGIQYGVNETPAAYIKQNDARITTYNGQYINVILGQQADGTFNLRFQDSNGIGIAQFGGFPDGRTSLRLAPSGIEVSTATADQLLFNSDQNVFKIVHTDIYDFTLPSGAARSYLNTVFPLYDHGLKSAPLVTGSIYLFNTYIYQLPYILVQASGTSSVVTDNLSLSSDATSVYLNASYLTDINGNPAGFGATGQIRYYVLQESAKTS